MPEPRSILTALAELAPARGDRVLDVTSGAAPLLWLAAPDRVPRGHAADRLAALDALRADERVLRLGIGFLLGVADDEGTRRTVRLPLATRPVRLERDRRGYRVVPAGDLEITPLVTDARVAAELEAAPSLGEENWARMYAGEAWVRAASVAAGFPVTGATWKPPAKMPDDRLTGATGSALFVMRDAVRAGIRGSLRDWAERPGLDVTAFARVYGTATGSTATGSMAGADPDAADDLIRTPLPLNAAQREVVRRARSEPVTVVSGPPGNGKSHAIVAAALDVVASGGSVLIATQSTHAAAVLGDLLARYPGPAPVLFGDAEHREALATGLGGVSPEVPDARVRAAEDRVKAAEDHVRALTGDASWWLEQELLAAEAPRWQGRLTGLVTDAPGFFETGADFEAADRLLAKRATDTGRLTRWLTGLRLRRLSGARRDVPSDRLTLALRAARCNRADAMVTTIGGTRLSGSWEDLFAAEEAYARAAGEHMRLAALGRRRWTRDGRRAASALATALRAGRNRRREMLAGLDGPALTNALPLWIGTVTDVEDLLPPVPALFDLVILDEASHIDQIRAAAALLRAKRAFVAGDPRQLRFVSFAADVDVASALARNGLDDRADVRRVSAFDLAAGAAPITWLGEHYRSAPHLIEFSAKRFYAGRMTVATRHPRNDRADLIDVVTVPGAVLDNGVNRAEADAVIGLVGKLTAEGVRGIGVLSPFRAQADALETALLNAFTVDEITGSGLRTGTVHSFQGSESEVIVASLGLVDGDSPSRVRFVADPNLFNVMITRARSRMLVVSSLSAPAGMIGDYLAHGERPAADVVYRPGRAGGGGAGGGVTGGGMAGGAWAARLGGQLTMLGLNVLHGYEVGPWVVDLVVIADAGSDARAVGLCCEVHPDGTAAHIDRQRELIRAGLDLEDAFPSRWQGDPVVAALALAQLFRQL